MDGRLLGASARLSLVASLCSFRSMSKTILVHPVPVLLSVQSAIPRAPTLPAYHWSGWSGLGLLWCVMACFVFRTFPTFSGSALLWPWLPISVVTFPTMPRWSPFAMRHSRRSCHMPCQSGSTAAPTLVGHICNVVEALPPGVTLGASLGGPHVPAVPRVKVSVAVVPTASQMSALSLSAAPPRSRSLSTGLWVSHPSPCQAVVNITDCPTCPLPHRLIPTEGTSVVIPVPRPAPPSSCPVPSASSLVLPSPASASALATAGLRAPAKQPAPGNAGLLLVAMDHRPQE